MKKVTIVMTTMTALKLGAIVLDCPDPLGLAGFYADLLGWSVAPDSGAEWADVVDPAGGPTVSFQRDEKYRPPTWPDPQRPQMLHLDVQVADLDAEHERALKLGATQLPGGGRTFRVYADPAGHPFCLCAC
jgi:Glyoxalase-like domain